MARLEIGVLVPLNDDPEGEMGKVRELGLRSCQMASWTPEIWRDELGDRLVAACRENGVQVSTFWTGYPGPAVWDFIDGPRTIGLVPVEFRATRAEALKQGAAFAARLGIGSITTHVGFLPEDPAHPDFTPTVDALRDVASRCRDLGIGFRFETGQETPVTLLRTIERIGLDNLGINLDTANLILYGKANPVDALSVFGEYVQDMHVKDGCYPTDGDHLGRETALGEGMVDIAGVIAGLKKLGYTGPLTIEREISGPQQIEDIRKAIAILEPLR